jgi:NADPH2:quinone reductase
MMAYPKTTLAITIAKPGGVEVLEKTEIPLEVEPDHVVIKVEYLGVNFIDTYFR